MTKLCDIILPVYNNLNFVKDCINEIIKNTMDCKYTFYIIDDNSDTKTAKYLKNKSQKFSQIILHRNKENLGFVQSCNLGIQMGTSPYIVLINSDVIVTPGWLSRLIECAESDPTIASVNPFTNYASNIDIPIAPGANFYTMDEILNKHSQKLYPDVVTGVGFCMLLRRYALEKVGLFDEIFGHGYCEESDLCMRLTTQGYRTVVADNVYVYHKGRGTFTDRGARYKKNRKIFDIRWADEYQRQFNEFRQANPLKPARDLFELPKKWDPIPSMRETYRRMRDCYRKKNFIGIAREAARGLKRLPNAKTDIVTSEIIKKFTRSGRLKVTYVLHNLAIAGGVLSVIQLVNELILLGVEARIVALREYPEIYNWKFYTKPIIYRNVDELIKNFPETDIAVATHWTTAYWVAEVVRSGKAKKSAYFIQDYESWFYLETDQESRSKVKETYKLIPNKIVKSDWLKGLLLQDGYQTKKIRLGMDLGIFYPREIKKLSKPVVLTMARPRTPRRGFPYVVEALKHVKELIPDIEIIMFGDDLSKHKIPFEYRDEGIITNQNKLAELYSSADVYLDGSNFQGFGRPALEAMACGTACVLTKVGGVTEYARDGKNCLLVHPKQPNEFAQAIIKIIKNEELKNTLIRGGMETVKDYCHKREAVETLEYFKSL